MKTLAIITTHPIQYNAPWFQLLAERNQCNLKVFYTWSQTKSSVVDRTFGKEITWDIPLLEGYDYEFVDNISKQPGSHHFFGIDCPTLISKIEDFQPDAILFFGWKFMSHLLAMRYFKGKVPIWFRGDSTLLDEVGGYKSTLRRFILRKIYGYIDKAFYVGEANKTYFLKHNLKQFQLVHAPHAIDTKRFTNDDINNYVENALLWREELGYSEDDIVVLFAGKLEPKKQPDLLINAIIKVNQTRTKSIKLLLVGNGPLESQLHKMAQGDQNIKFLPFQNQTKMPLVYRLGTIFCLPSKGPGETWGLAINEAMACSRPVIVSNKVGCTQDLVRQNENGYIFAYNQIEELISILTDISNENLEILGLNAKQTIQNYNFETIVKAIENELFKI